MLQTTNLEELRATVAGWRAAGERVALVPTMGNLHAGHLSLVERAGEHAERVVVSVFVNPTQFGEGEDFEAYPRTLAADRDALEASRASLLFAPGVETVYPFGEAAAVRVRVPMLTEELEGACRPGHFDGVTTVVSRLLFMVGPEVAVFGQKDYQQLLVIRRMVADLSIPVTVVCAPTVREADGLALSSRNQYLGSSERARAPRLHATLRRVREELLAGERDLARLERDARERLRAAGFAPDYVAIRSAEDLSPAGPGGGALVILAAARLGQARLIDNLLVRDAAPRRDRQETAAARSAADAV